MNEPTPVNEQNIEPHQKMSAQNRTRVVLLIAIAVLLAAVAGAYAYLYTQQSKELQALLAADAPADVKESTKAPSESGNTVSTSGAAGSQPLRQLPGLSPGRNPQALTIKEWGVRLHLPTGPDMGIYTYAEFRSGDAFGLSNDKLAQSNCKASNGALGFLSRYKEGSFPQAGGSLPVFAGRIDGFDYGYTAPQSPCGQNAGLESILAARLYGAVRTIEPVR